MPNRKTIPNRIKLEVRLRQNGYCGCHDKCGVKLPADGKGLVEYQHFPALQSRAVNDDDSDWIPAQHDANFILAEISACHKRETNKGRSGATRLGSDRHAINKTKWILGEFKGPPKRKWVSKGFDKTLSRGFNGKVTKRVK